MKRIYFTVTNVLTYDQRMHRICSTLAEHGYEPVLVGRRYSNSPPLLSLPFRQKRLKLLFKKGKLFYAEYNFRLFFFLLFRKMDAICAIDLDTIIPCLWISKLKHIPRVYDAHEMFTEMKEVRSRTDIHKIWLRVERYAVPQFKKGYTVGDFIAEEFHRRYGVNYQVIRNLPSSKNKSAPGLKEVPTGIILYQGAVNEGRGFEFLVPAMKQIDAELWICGDGNFMEKLKALIRSEGVQDKIKLKGMMTPPDLWKTSLQADIGIFLPDREGLNQYYSLPNKFFDYIQAGLPQITANYPEYKKLNDQYNVAILLDDYSIASITNAVSGLLHDTATWKLMQQNCIRASKELNWEMEEEKLLSFYSAI